MRIFFLMILMGMVILSVLATDLYLPSLPSLVSYFGTTQNNVQLSLSFYLAPFAFCMLLVGPLSDRYGRRKVFLGSLLIDLCGGALCLFANCIECFLVGRVLQAFGGCGGTVLGRIIARDSFVGAACTKVLAYLFTAISCAIAITPALGGMLQKLFDWKGSFIFLLGYSGLLLSGSWIVLTETLQEESRKSFHLKRIFQNYFLIIKNFQFRYFCCLITCVWSGFFAFVAGSSFIYIEVLNQSPQLYGVLFALIMGGMVVGTLLTAHVLSCFQQQTSIFLGTALCVGAGIFLFFIPPSVFMTSALMTLFQMGCGILLPFCQMGATQSVPTLMSSSFSLLYFSKMLGASFAGILVGFFPMGAVIGFFAFLTFFTFWRMVKLGVFSDSAQSL